MAYAPAMNKGTAVVLLVLGGLLVLGAGAMVFTSTSTSGGTSCGSVMSPSDEDIGIYDFGAPGACDSAHRTRTTYAIMLGLAGVACLLFGGWLLNDSPAAEPTPGPPTPF